MWLLHSLLVADRRLRTPPAAGLAAEGGCNGERLGGMEPLSPAPSV